uniref:Putative secreted protein n=1 Tax=Ixodes ricinus TaxID=34613 RepID=V5H101_IXORI
MCRNISNILFVLFAVVLGLAASEGEGSENNIVECYRAAKPIGDILCPLYGYDEFDGVTFNPCELGCGSQKVRLPKEACPKDSLPRGCSEELARTLTKWYTDMRNRKDDLLKKWCTNAFQG